MPKPKVPMTRVVLLRGHSSRDHRPMFLDAQATLEEFQRQLKDARQMGDDLCVVVMDYSTEAGTYVPVSQHYVNPIYITDYYPIDL